MIHLRLLYESIYNNKYIFSSKILKKYKIIIQKRKYLLLYNDNLLKYQLFTIHNNYINNYVLFIMTEIFDMFNIIITNSFINLNKI